MYKENFYALFLAICGGKDHKGMTGEDALIAMKLKSPVSRNFKSKKGDSNEEAECVRVPEDGQRILPD